MRKNTPIASNDFRAGMDKDTSPQVLPSSKYIDAKDLRVNRIESTSAGFQSGAITYGSTFRLSNLKGMDLALTLPNIPAQPGGAYTQQVELCWPAQSIPACENPVRNIVISYEDNTCTSAQVSLTGGIFTGSPLFVGSGADTDETLDALRADILAWITAYPGITVGYTAGAYTLNIDTGTTADDLVAAAAKALNAIPAVSTPGILFQSSGTLLFVYSTHDIGPLGYTDNVGTKVLAPVLELSETPEDAYMDVRVSRDQVICVRMYAAEYVPEYATAYFTLGTDHDDTSTFSISTTPALFGAPVVGNWQGTNALTAKHISELFNAYIEEGTSINPLDLMAGYNGDQVLIRVSVDYLTSLGLVPSGVSLNTPILAGAGTLGTTQLVFDAEGDATVKNYETSICSPLVCRLTGLLSDTWMREYSATCYTPNNCLPLSSRISSGLSAITDYVCRGLLCDADKLIQYLSGLSNHNKCRGC